MPLPAAADESPAPVRAGLRRAADRIGVVLPRVAHARAGPREVRPPRVAVFWHPLAASAPFRHLFMGDVLVKTGERCFALVSAWWLLAGPHAQPSRLGALLTIESLPILAVGALIGPLIDRASKARCMAVSAGLQGAILAAGAVLTAVDALSFLRLCALAVAVGALIPVFETAAAASLPALVSDTQLAGAAALQSMAVEFSNVLAALVAAVTLSLGGFTAALTATAAMYMLAGLSLARLHVPRSTQGVRRHSYLRDLGSGLAYVGRRPALASFVALYLAELFLMVPLLVLVPMLVQAAQGGAVGWVAALEIAFSAGAIVAALVLSAGDAAQKPRQRSAVALGSMAVCMLALVAVRLPAAMIPEMTVMGACVAVLIGVSNALFQRSVPDQLKGRFFGLVETLGAAVTPVGYMAVGLAFGWAGVRGVLEASACGLVLLAAVALRVPRPEAHRVYRRPAPCTPGSER